MDYTYKMNQSLNSTRSSQTSFVQSTSVTCLHTKIMTCPLAPVWIVAIFVFWWLDPTEAANLLKRQDRQQGQQDPYAPILTDCPSDLEVRDAADVRDSQ